MNELSMNSHSIEVWRVNTFTTTPFTGNPAGVVPDADGLSDRLMLAIAGELNWDCPSLPFPISWKSDVPAVDFGLVLCRSKRCLFWNKFGSIEME